MTQLSPQANKVLSAVLVILVGCGLAFQGLPDVEKELFGKFAPPIVSIILGGLYALEKYLQVTYSKPENVDPPKP